MKLIEQWKDEFGINQPFLLDDLVSESVSYDVAKNVINRYIQQNVIKRYCQGVYYFPKYTEFGELVPAYFDVVSKRFIQPKDEVIGYVSGCALLNQLSISMQVPNTIEISTNKEHTRKRIIKLRNREVILRKPIIPISSDNVMYLQFLDIFKYASVDMIKDGKSQIIDFYFEKNLDFNEINRYLQHYTLKVSKKMKESGLYDELASLNRNSNIR